ncbi:Rho GDP-dissociation inhibitor 1 [Lamellibrachia satsuma]|nr:Rho GDP-dissociation inhibitor 1 [Lamellibrachia satsuma]
MAEQDKDFATEEEATNYKAPAEKSVNEIFSLDTEDESLRKYKETLLGSTASEVFPSDPRWVIVQKLALLVDGRQDMELDLTQSLAEIKKKTFILKEGCHYKVKIYFYVQREIVSGLKYNQKSYRKGLQDATAWFHIEIAFDGMAAGPWLLTIAATKSWLPGCD